MTRATLIQAREGDRLAMNRVIKYFNGSVYHQARRQVEPGSTFFDDYLQEGRIALLTALHDADLDRINGFYTYAANVMRSHMLKFSDQTQEVPWHHYTHVNQFLKFKDQLELEKKREFDTEEVLLLMDKKPFEKQWIRDVLKREKIRFSVDPLGVRLLENEINEEHELETLSDVRKKVLKALMVILTSHQEDVLNRFYYQGQTAEEIAEDLGLSKQSIWSVIRLAKGRLIKYWQLGFFLFAFNSSHFYDVQYTFQKEAWKPIIRDGIDVLVSNYGRVKRIKHCHRRDFIIAPRMNEGFYRYQLYYTGDRKSWKVSVLNLITDHFTNEELPTFYERI